MLINAMAQKLKSIHKKRLIKLMRNAKKEGAGKMVNGFVRLPVYKLVKAQWNYKENDIETHNKLTRNIKENGLIENLMVRELSNDKYEIINGNHRFDSILENGLDNIMCYNFGPISQAQAERIAYETNETRFDSDESKLNQIIADLIVEFGVGPLTTTLPFSQKKMDDINQLLNSVEIDDTDLDDSKYVDEIINDKTLVLMLDHDDADNFNTMILRFKSLLFPSAKPSEVSSVIPIKAIIQLLKSIPEEALLGIGG